MPSLQCQNCGAPVTIDEPIPRDAECASCGRDLRCCRNCRHYDTSRNNSCRETEAELVEDKARRNFCEFFYFSRAPFAGPAGKSPADARAKLEALFGGTAAAPDATRTAREKLDNLFGGGKPPERPEQDPKAAARRKLEGLFRPPADDSDSS